MPDTDPVVSFCSWCLQCCCWVLFAQQTQPRSAQSAGIDTALWQALQLCTEMKDKRGFPGRVKAILSPLGTHWLYDNNFFTKSVNASQHKKALNCVQRFQMTETLPHSYWAPENSSALSMACYKAITSSHLRKKNSLFDINFFQSGKKPVKLLNWLMKTLPPSWAKPGRGSQENKIPPVNLGRWSLNI